MNTLQAAKSPFMLMGSGFATKQDGHGFGLHSGALAAKEMGGSLRAESKGPGTGATFILELPLESATANPSVQIPSPAHNQAA